MAITNQSELESKYELPDGTIETENTLSNETITENLTEDFTKVKSSSSSFATPNTELTQTITLTNNSTFEISDISIKDTMSDGATFVDGSVTIDGTSYASYDPIDGFDLPSTIAVSGSSVITYKVLVDEDPTVEQLTNTAAITYTADEQEFTENTNTVTVDIYNNKISIVKSADVDVVISGGTITFTSVITNDGTITNTDLVFTDDIPEGTTFITDSVTVDGVARPGEDPSEGIDLEDLAGGDSTTVTFKVRVN